MVSEKMLALGTARSCIRELFEYGLRQAAAVGKENVYDYSLGNPSSPAPAKVNETFISVVRDTDSLHTSSLQPSRPLRNILQTRAMTFHSRTLITT